MYCYSETIICVVYIVHVYSDLSSLCRAETILSATIVRPDDSNSTKMSILLQTDIKGWIPYFIVNRFARKKIIEWRNALYNFYHDVYSKRLAKQQAKKGIDEGTKPE